MKFGTFSCPTIRTEWVYWYFDVNYPLSIYPHQSAHFCIYKRHKLSQQHICTNKYHYENRKPHWVKTIRHMNSWWLTQIHHKWYTNEGPKLPQTIYNLWHIESIKMLHSSIRQLHRFSPINFTWFSACAFPGFPNLKLSRLWPQKERDVPLPSSSCTRTRFLSTINRQVVTYMYNKIRSQPSSIAIPHQIPSQFISTNDFNPSESSPQMREHHSYQCTENSDILARQILVAQVFLSQTTGS